MMFDDTPQPKGSTYSKLGRLPHIYARAVRVFKVHDVNRAISSGERGQKKVVG